MIPLLIMVTLVALSSGTLPIPAASAQPVAGRTIQPVDEGDKDASFAAFRQRLLRAAKAGDIGAVLEALSRDIKYNEQLAAGSLAQFRRRWSIDSDPKPFLDDLIDILQLGGRFDAAGDFVAPYTYTAFPGSIWDMKTHVVVIRADAPVFDTPSESVPPFAKASYLILESSGALRWASVTLPDGRRGFTRGADVRQPSGPRAYFRKVGDEWKLVVFAAGLD